MQSYLPDINTKYITYARVVLSSLSSRKWSSCFGGLYSINALLPAKYRIDISTSKYNAITKEDTIAICNNCKSNCNHCINPEPEKEGEPKQRCRAEINYDDIKIVDVLSSSTLLLITDSQTQKVWFCPNCKNENLLQNTHIIKSKNPEPIYITVLPEPPQRRDGILDRISYDRKAEQWVWNALNVLDERMARFREDNWNREEEDLDMKSIDTTTEENMLD